VLHKGNTQVSILMKASDVFGIVVRACGLFIALNGFWYLTYVVFLVTGAVSQDPLAEAEARDYFFPGVAWLLAGTGLLRGASWVIRFTYPEDELKDQAEVTDS
jgi:hypothetical protein